MERAERIKIKEVTNLYSFFIDFFWENFSVIMGRKRLKIDIENIVKSCDVGYATLYRETSSMFVKIPRKIVSIWTIIPIPRETNIKGHENFKSSLEKPGLIL